MELIEIAKGLIKAKEEGNIELWFKCCKRLDKIKPSCKDKFVKTIYEFRSAFFEVSTKKEQKQFQKILLNLEKLTKEEEKKYPTILKKVIKRVKGKMVKRGIKECR